MNELIQILSERKLTRQELSDYLGVPDRQCRMIIEKLRNEGHLVINNGDGYTIEKDKTVIGYFLATYYQTIKSQLRTFEAMAESYKNMK